MDIRSLKSLENNVVLHQEALPINRLKLYLDHQWRPNRSANLRDWSAHWLWLFRRTWPIDRVLGRDRSVVTLPLFAILQILAWSIGWLCPTDRWWFFPSTSFLFRSRLLRFVCFFISIFEPLLKWPVHSQNSSNHINLRILTTIQVWIYDIWVSILLAHQLASPLL